LNKFKILTQLFYSFNILIVSRIPKTLRKRLQGALTDSQKH